MNRFRLRTAALLLAVPLALAGCSGGEDEVPTAPGNGEDGEDGDAGEDGEDGEDDGE